MTRLKSADTWSNELFNDLSLFILFIYFILFATLITKNIGKEEEKKKRSGEET